MSSKVKIGIFDSGLGGLTVLRSCVDAVINRDLDCSNIEFIYLGDNARVPYGSKSPATIKKYGTECALFLKSQNTDYVIVACNTVCAHALQEVETTVEQSVIETITPSVQVAIESTTTKTIGVIGTAATCASNAYQKAINAINPDIKVTSIACPLFVPLVEQGMFEGEIVDKIIQLYLEPFKNTQVDTIILGCTHYPLLTKAINKYFDGKIKLVACSDAIANCLVEKLKNNHSLLLQKTSENSKQTPHVEFFVTDELSYFNSLATKCLDGIEVNSKIATFPI
jgi:glutamate racemase